MYKGIVKIVRKNNDNTLRITNLKYKGKPLEYAVKMREIPEWYRLENLLFMRKVNFKTIERLVEIRIRFHIRTRTSKEIQRYGQPKFINKKINENFNTIAKLQRSTGSYRKY
jgi:aminoglycoside phosphotransferase family enzyme